MRAAVRPGEAEARCVGHLAAVAAELGSLGVGDLGRERERRGLRLARPGDRSGRLELLDGRIVQIEVRLLAREVGRIGEPGMRIRRGGACQGTGLARERVERGR